MGGDRTSRQQKNVIATLKSTPPAWAGTAIRGVFDGFSLLKSTPPAWAGTIWKKKNQI